MKLFLETHSGTTEQSRDKVAGAVRDFFYRSDGSLKDQCRRELRYTFDNGTDVRYFTV